LLGMHALVGICAFITWLIIAFSFRFSSLAALSAALLSPVYMLWLTGLGWLTGATIIMSAVVLWRHRSNFRQLLEGTEDTIGSGTFR
jgi:glycerol-3-phosphate acyltransferase PlsY